MVRMLLLYAFGVLALCGTKESLAKAPCVQFDVTQVVSARDVSALHVEMASPADKLIRLEIPISALVRLGREEALLQYLYLVSGIAQPFEIVDYAPKTALLTDVTGNVEVEESSGRSSALGVQAYAPHSSPVKADANANLGSTSSHSVRFEHLPPRQLIAASGTMHRGRSAYFKLKPSTQTTLEGDKTFEIIARVPASWRAGLMHVRCAAYAKPRGFATSLDEAELVCGSRGFLVGVFLDSDSEAKRHVWRLLQAQQQLRRLAKTEADEIADRRYPTLGHKLGASLALVKPRIPNNWLDLVVGSAELPSLVKHLPTSVRKAAIEYHRARQNVLALSQPKPTGGPALFEAAAVARPPARAASWLTADQHAQAYGLPNGQAGRRHL